LPFANICLDLADSCNDFFLVVEASGPGIYALQGHESGCEFSDRLASGVMTLSDGKLRLGLTTNSGARALADYGSIGSLNAVIDLATRSGTFVWTISYLQLGVPAGHGYSGSLDFSFCASSTDAPANGPDRQAPR
jgi:hypothetical protein